MNQKAVLELLGALLQEHVPDERWPIKRGVKSPKTVELKRSIIVGQYTIAAGTEVMLCPPKPRRKVFEAAVFFEDERQITIMSDGRILPKTVKKQGGAKPRPRRIP